MSATHSRSGASASKRRSTRSGAGRAWGARRVVRGPFRRLPPAKPASRIARATRLARSPARPQRPAPRESSVPRTVPPLTGAPRVVPARGDSEHSGHRGNAALDLIRSDEPVELPGPVSRANQAVAFAKMSRASRRRGISRRTRRSSSRSAVLGPSPRRPSSRSAGTTQLRSACAVGSNSRDNSSGLRPARTNSTIWRRNSGAYGGLDWSTFGRQVKRHSPWSIPPPPKGQVSTISDQLHSFRGRAKGKHGLVRNIGR